MAYLYIRADGTPHQRHSFSAGLDFDQSPSKYYLRRIVGWRERDSKASLLFGRVIEQAIQFYHDNRGSGLLEEFQRLWAPAASEALTYTKKEKDWATLSRMGSEMLRLYEIRRPSLPIPLGGASVFQRNYSKEVFPGDPNYGEIFDEGKLDIVAYVEPSHPLLTPVQWKPEYGLLRPVIIDMKTSGVDYSEQMGMAAYDRQLRRYSWQSGIRDVAFLVFVKKGFAYKRKSRVTLLTDAGNYKAGTEMLAASAYDGGAWLVSSVLAMDDMDKAQGRRADGKLDTTKAAQERKDLWLRDNALKVPEADFTRQRLQFNAGFVTKEMADTAGHIAARQIVQIVNSWKTNSWPDTFGIRYPQDDSQDPYFRAFVLGDEAFKAEHFKLSNPNEINDLFDEDPEPEIGDEE